MSSTATSRSTLVLTRRDVSRLLDMGECIAAVERAFALHATGATMAPGVLGSHVAGGGFHVKTAGLMGDEHVFVTKVNANFPESPTSRGLPT
jgi:alanine dehydrogenase